MLHDKDYLESSFMFGVSEKSVELKKNWKG
jgi:hypothetical protein